MDKENFQPFPNVPKKGVAGTLLFQARLFFDFQVATVHRSLGDFFHARKLGKVLEVGGGLSPYRHLIKTPNYWSLDPYHLEKEFGYFSKSIKYDGANFPFKSDSFDILFHTEVMEHIFDTHFFLSECSRVLKKNAPMFFTVPFAARFHYQPHDYWRFTPSSLRALCISHGFEVSSITPRGDAMVVILNKLMVFALAMSLGGKSRKPAALLARIIWIPITALALPVLAALGQLFLRTGWVKNTDDCLGFSVICLKSGS